MKKAVLLITTIIFVLSTMLLPASAAGFSDVPSGKWYTEPVQFCAQKGYVSGYKDGSFKPNKNITRAEMAVIMNKFCKDRGVIQKDVSVAENRFKDVQQGKWYTQAIINCVSAGIMTGYSGTVFGVNDKLTREQSAVIITRALNMCQHRKLYSKAFQDDSDIDRWAQKSVSLVNCYGIMNGIGNNRFAPLKAVTRAEVATIIAVTSKIDEKTVRIENSLNNAVQATYNLEDLFYEEQLNNQNYNDIDFDEIKNLDYKKIDIKDSRIFWYLIRDWANTYWINDITDTQVMDIAYAMYAYFDGTVPKFERKDFEYPSDDLGPTYSIIDYENGEYHFLFGNRGEISNRVKDYIENADGSLDVEVETVGSEMNKAVSRYKVHMIPNKHVHERSGEFEFYYTVDDVTYLW